jgi:hypothetical protein
VRGKNVTENEWRFSDPPNLVSITTRKIVDGEHYIGFVSHDEDDGCWQFLSSQNEHFDPADAMLVGLSTIVSIDSSVNELADLPLGWSASRNGKSGAWVRSEHD